MPQRGSRGLVATVDPGGEGGGPKQIKKGLVLRPALL